MYQGSEEIQINWGEMNWSNKIQNNDNLHKLRCFTVSRLSKWKKGNIKPCNKRHAEDKKREWNNVFCGAGHTGCNLWNKTDENKTHRFGPLCLIPVMKMREEIHKSNKFFSLNCWKVLRYCTAEWGTKMQTDRWARTFTRKGDLYLWSCISTVSFFTGPLCIVFAARTLPTVFFHTTLHTFPFKTWTQPFMLTTLRWRLSRHHPPLNAGEHRHPAGHSRANQAIGGLNLCQIALTHGRCFILCSCFLVNLCALLPLQYSLTQVTCTVNIYLTLRFI